MISLAVENYCHECPEFTPYATSFEVYDYDNKREKIDILVQCENKDQCAIIREYLKQQLESKRSKN